MYLGEYEIDEYIDILATTHKYSSGAAYAATSITYRVYEDGGTTEIITDTTMGAAFDSITGFYYVRLQLTAAAGFEIGKNYVCLIQATVDSLAAIQAYSWRVKFPAVNVKQINSVATSSVTTINANQGTTQPINFTGTGASALAKSDAIDINSVAASSVTAINANIGTTQPVNFTGTSTSALVKSDMVDVAGAAVSTSTAQIGVNAVQVGGAAPDDSADIATAVWQDATAGDFTVSSSIGKSLYTSGTAPGTTGGLSTVPLAYTSGAVATDAGNSAAQVKTNLSESTDNYWNDALIVLTSGAMAGQVKKVTDYNGTSKTLTFGAFTGTPADGVTFILVNR